MASREEYNNCMRPYMTGTKTKKERQHDMCVGAKVCSGKAKTDEEAEKICSAPTLPKWAKRLLPKDEKPISCEDRLIRARDNLETIATKVKSGEAGEARVQAAQTIDDIHKCLPEPVIVEMVDEAMGQFAELSKGYYFKGESRDLQDRRGSAAGWGHCQAGLVLVLDSEHPG